MTNFSPVSTKFRDKQPSARSRLGSYLIGLPAGRAEKRTRNIYCLYEHEAKGQWGESQIFFSSSFRDSAPQWMIEYHNYRQRTTLRNVWNTVFPLMMYALQSKGFYFFSEIFAMRTLVEGVHY